MFDLMVRMLPWVRDQRPGVNVPIDYIPSHPPVKPVLASLLKRAIMIEVGDRKSIYTTAQFVEHPPIFPSSRQATQ